METQHSSLAFFPFAILWNRLLNSIEFPRFGFSLLIRLFLAFAFKGVLCRWSCDYLRAWSLRTHFLLIQIVCKSESGRHFTKRQRCLLKMALFSNILQMGRSSLCRLPFCGFLHWLHPVLLKCKCNNNDDTTTEQHQHNVDEAVMLHTPNTIDF